MIRVGNTTDITTIYVTTGGGGSGNWILATGFWDDSGVWDDASVWID